MKSIKASYGININFIFGGMNETEEWDGRMQLVLDTNTHTSIKCSFPAKIALIYLFYNPICQNDTPPPLGTHTTKK